MCFGRLLVALFALILPSKMLHAEISWQFDGTASATGARVKLCSGKPAFVATEKGQGLAPGVSLEYADLAELRLRPELGIRCRFRLNEVRKYPQVLATKDGEYLLRVNGTDEGGCLAFFVKIEGRWEGRLNGPVVEAGKWYDVDVVWSGQRMRMDVNGETFELARSGRINPGEKPLQVGPIVGVIDRLEIRNPSLTRTTFLAKLAASSAGQAASQDSSSSQEPIQFGGETGWNGWQGYNGANCETRGEQLRATFPAASSMLISPALVCELGPRPFICLALELADPGWTGVLDFVTDAGTGSISFAPQWEGRPTVIAGSTSEAWTGTLRRLSLSFSGGKGAVTIKQLALADRPIGKPSFYIRALAPGRAKLRPNREETVIAGIENVGGEAERICARLSVPQGVTLLDQAERTLPYLGMDDFDMATWRFCAEKPGTYTVRVEVSAKGAGTRTKDLTLVIEP